MRANAVVLGILLVALLCAPFASAGAPPKEPCEKSQPVLASLDLLGTNVYVAQWKDGRNVQHLGIYFETNDKDGFQPESSNGCKADKTYTEVCTRVDVNKPCIG